MSKPDTSAEELRSDLHLLYSRKVSLTLSTAKYLIELNDLITSYTKQRERALLERLEKSVRNLPTWESSSMVEGEDVLATIQKEKEQTNGE